MIAAQGGWHPVPPGPALHAGDRNPRVVALRARLHASGDLESAPTDAQLFDPSLEDAIRRFQARHGLHPDGVVGAKTLAAMNVPVEVRLRQIVLNLERMRSAPAATSRHVVVNIAAQELEVFENGARVLVMRVVVGEPERPTPLFVSSLTHLVLNPYWSVPPRIARRDLLPKVQAEPAHLVAQGFRVLSDWTGDAIELDPLAIDWSAFGDAPLPFKLRQDPGPANALGQIKFMLPNDDDVYLHDTPSRHLFAREVRAFSSGCIRLEAPVQLAVYLLERGGWSEAGLRREIATGATKAIRLPEPVPISLTYVTAWADEEGRAHFRADIYGLDARVARHLFPGEGPAGGEEVQAGARLARDSVPAAAGTPAGQLPTPVSGALAP